jgi:hypothetical protein
MKLIFTCWFQSLHRCFLPSLGPFCQAVSDEKIFLNSSQSENLITTGICIKIFAFLMLFTYPFHLWIINMKSKHVPKANKKVNWNVLWTKCWRIWHSHASELSSSLCVKLSINIRSIRYVKSPLVRFAKFLELVLVWTR